jgi:hypothetical protein
LETPLHRIPPNEFGGYLQATPMAFHAQNHPAGSIEEEENTVYVATIWDCRQNPVKLKEEVGD